MPWTCQYCGKVGDRQGVDAEKIGLRAGERFCQREGLATLKGQIACCNCLLTVGWNLDSYYSEACHSCIRSAGRKLPPDSARRRAAKQIQEQLKQLTLTKESNVSASSETAQRHKPDVEVIKVFDFDDCLFKTPERPDWWPSNAYTEMMESLLPPLVPDHVTEDWWEPELVREAKLAFEDPNTHSVLLTFRGDAFKNRIQALLRQQNIRFNEIRCRPLSPFLCSLESSTGRRGAACAQLRRTFPQLVLANLTARDRHTAIHIGDLLEICTKAHSLHVFAGDQRADSIAGILTPTNLPWTTSIHTTLHSPHAGGVPCAEELRAIAERKAAVQEAMLRTNRIIHTFATTSEPRTISQPRTKGSAPMKVSQQVRVPDTRPPVSSSATARRVPFQYPAAKKRTGPVRNRTFWMSSLNKPQPTYSKRWGPKAQPLHASRAWAPEADATDTVHFKNDRGGSKAPRGRTVASKHRGMYLSAWEEERYGYDVHSSDEEEWWDERDSELGESFSEPEHSFSEREHSFPPAFCDDRSDEHEGDEEIASACTWLQAPGEDAASAAAASAHFGERDGTQSDGQADWDVLSSMDAESVSSDWYERDLDVMSVASVAADVMSVASESAAADEEAWSEVDNEDVHDHDLALALYLTEASQDPKHGSDGRMGSWSCGMCTFVNAPSTWQCDMCSVPRPREVPQGVEAANFSSEPEAGGAADDTTSSPLLVSSAKAEGAFANDTAPKADDDPSLSPEVGENREIDRSFSCSVCGAENEGCPRCCKCGAHPPEEWRPVMRRGKQRSAQKEPTPSQIRSEAYEPPACDCDFCTLQCSHLRTADRDADVWSGEGCQRRGLKGSKFRTRGLNGSRVRMRG